MIKIISFSKLDQINHKHTSLLLWFSNQSSLILFAPHPIISNWFDKNGKQTNSPWLNRGSNKSVARQQSQEITILTPILPQPCARPIGSKGRFCNATVARSRSAIVSPLYAYQFTSTCGPGSIALDLLRILDTFDLGTPFSRVGRTDTFVQPAKRSHSILREVYGWTVSLNEERCLPDSRA